MTCLCAYVPAGMRCVFCWARDGFPGAVSFPPERQPDPRAGLCTVPGCNNVELYAQLCERHWARSRRFVLR